LNQYELITKYPTVNHRFLLIQKSTYILRQGIVLNISNQGSITKIFGGIIFVLELLIISLYEEGRYFLVWSSTLLLLKVHNLLDQIRKYLPSS
jgi:hypothetical protein